MNQKLSLVARLAVVLGASCCLIVVPLLTLWPSYSASISAVADTPNAEAALTPAINGSPTVKPTTAKPNKRPNLLFIMADQQRYDALSIAGKNQVLHTPNMDRIAREGVYFTNANSQCAVCGPARTSLLTGHSIENTNVRTNKDASVANITTVPSYDEILVSMEGYVAEYYGKWHAPLDLARIYRNEIFFPGFPKPYHDYLDSVGIHEPNSSAMKNGTQKHSFNRRAYQTNPLDKRHGLPPGSNEADFRKAKEPDQHGISEIPEEHTLTAFNAKVTIDAMERLAKDDSRPFSLHCSFFCPHAPITPSEPFASMFSPNDMIPPASIHDTMENSPYINANGRRELPQYSDPDLLKFMTANYYAFVKEIDVWLGRILDKLDELGLANNTLLVYTADHGEMLGAHGMREKNVFYEESVHVPLLMRFPGTVSPGTVVEDPVSHVDVFSTILDYLGANEQESDGNSLRRLVEGQTNGDKEEYTVSEWNNGSSDVPGLMVRTRRWKLFIPNTADSKVLNVLYDMEHDLHEMNNLLCTNPVREHHVVIAEKLKAVLVEWLVMTNSPHVEQVKNRSMQCRFDGFKFNE